MHALPSTETQQKDKTAQESSTAVNRTGVPDVMKRQYEAMSGLSMDDVRVHYNSARPAQVDALAYTQGSHVYVAPGQERHLGHELGHVIQQKQGRVRPTGSIEGFAVNLDEGLEREADALDRQARTYEMHGGESPAALLSGDEEAEEFGSMAVGTSVSGGVAQLRPVVDSVRQRPFYVDSEFNEIDKPRFLLKYFVEMGRYVVFQIRDHVRRIFWKKDRKWMDDNPDIFRERQALPVAGMPDAGTSEAETSHAGASGAEIAEAGISETKILSVGMTPSVSQDLPEQGADQHKYYTDRDFKKEFSINDFLKVQPLDAWLESYEEAGAAIGQINTSGLDSEEKERQKNAIMNYTFQRYIVNALYRAEEIERMEYSGSPLSYQDRSTYMRSGAGSFVKALQQLLGGKKEYGKADLILTRSEGMREELDKFFYTLRLEDGASSVDEMRERMRDSSVIQKIAEFVEQLTIPNDEKDPQIESKQDRTFWESLEESDLTKIFADMTEGMNGQNSNEQLQTMGAANQKLRAAVFLQLADQMRLAKEAELILLHNNFLQGQEEHIQIINTRLQREEGERQIFLQTYMSELEQQINDIPARIQKTEEQTERLKKQIQELEESIRGLEAQIQELQIQMQEAQKQDTKNQIKKLSAEMQQLENQKRKSEKLRENTSKKQQQSKQTKQKLEEQRKLLENILLKAKSLQSGGEIEPKDNVIADRYIRYIRDNHPKESFSDSMGKLEVLLRNMGYIASAGGMISLESGGIRQSALLLADTKMDIPAKAAVNKAGYVPSITEGLRSMMQYQKEDESHLSIQDIAKGVFAQQKKGEAVEGSAGERAMELAEKRLSAPVESQYAASDSARARNFAQGCFERFCAKLVDSKGMGNPEKRISVQASVIKKLIDASGLFANDNVPAFVWYQLEYYLDAALHSENHLVDFTRNIQGIHEIILLGIELSGKIDRGKPFFLPQAPNDDSEQGLPPSFYRGAYLADYGLKAFAQVYDAALAQHAQTAPTDEGKPLHIGAFYNIYFELTEKLNATKGANPNRVHMDNPKNVEEFLDKLHQPVFESDSEEGVHPADRLPDIIMIDIHPNDATREYIEANNIVHLLQAIAGYREQNEIQKQMSVIIDITLNQATDEEVQGIVKKSQTYIREGWLNLVFVQSLTKFAQMGMDKHSGGLVFAYNHEDQWEAFNESLGMGKGTDPAAPADPVDPYMQEYFQLLFTNAGEEQREYIRIIRENTRYVQSKLSGMLANTAIQLSENEDEGSCYVAWHYRESYQQIRRALYYSQHPELSELPQTTESLELPELPYTLHDFNIAILEQGINRLMSKRRLPVAMRFSFGFPISNLGETGNEVRFTIGTETKEELDVYMDVIRTVAAAVQALIDTGAAAQETLLDIKKFKNFLHTI